MRSRYLGTALLASAAMGVAGIAAPAFGAHHNDGTSAARENWQSSVRVMYDRGVHPNLSGLSNAAGTTPTSVTRWKRTVKDGTKSFRSVMVGKNPTVKLANPVTVIKTAVVPVILHFTDGNTLNPAQPDACSTKSAVANLTASPLFQAKKYTWGGTPVGTGQYTSIFQRAEFRKFTKPTGLNPKYQVALGKNVVPAITVNVPSAQSTLFGDYFCKNGNALPAEGIEINWWDNYVQNTLLPQLASQGFGPKTFPFFVTDSVFWYITNTNNCCVLGYHSATSVGTNAIQTYGNSMYMSNIDPSTGFGPSVQDVGTASHEIAEWMDDPFGNNPTKPWGHIGQVSGCQSNLEVGDPLSGTVQPTSLGGRIWHTQELAFFQWFYHISPSTAVNGWFSSNNTFKHDAAICS